MRNVKDQPLRYIRKVFLICLMVLIILPSAVSGQVSYQFERMWPTLTQPWYFFYPDGLTVDANGNIYICDTWNHRIQKFNADGFFITMWGSRGSADGQFEFPSDVAVDTNGNVYVRDMLNYRIQKFTSDGTYLTKWGSLGTGDGDFGECVSIPPEGRKGVAVDSLGNVYVTDTFNHRIQKFGPDGSFIATWGNKGDGAEQFDTPEGVDIDNISGTLYVADRQNHRIQRCTLDGQFLTPWGTSGFGDGEFNFPCDVVVNNSGSIYVVDRSNQRIQKLDTNGNFVKQLDSSTVDDGVSFMPDGIGISTNDNIYVTNSDGNFILKFNAEDLFVNKWAASGNEDGKFRLPQGIAVDSNGVIYVTETGNDRIQKFSPNGSHLSTWTTYGDGEIPFTNPKGITVDNDGNMYIVSGHTVTKLDASGNHLATWGSRGGEAEQFYAPQGITVDNNTGYIYVADTYNHRIQKLTTEGNFETQWPVGSQESLPVGVTTDNDGNVYVLNQNDLTFQKFTQNGYLLWTRGGEGTGDGEFGGYQGHPLYQGPYGIATDGNTYVYIADTLNNRIQQFNLDGNFFSKWGIHGTSPGQMNLPHGMAVFNDRIYVVDHENHRVQVFEEFETLNSKAIIVAGGGPYPGNHLWDATQFCANFAHRALTYQGLSKGDIRYLSSNTSLDLDGNNDFDDVSGPPIRTNLRDAITDWAVREEAENLILYLNDHGGPDTFRLHERTEEDDGILRAAQLAEWLDTFQESTSGKVVVVYEACESGSFLNELQGSDRIIITSAQLGEQAKFLNQGTISFSHFFWTNIFNGFSLGNSFTNANQAVNSLLSEQTPQLIGNAQNVYIGREIQNMVGDPPQIESGSVSISDLREIDGVTSVDIFASVSTDPDGVARVWAEVWPPDYIVDLSENPLLSLPLPSVELFPVGEDQYKGTFDKFTQPGVYQVAVYAMDKNNTISQPQFSSISYLVTRRAIIVAGGAGADLRPTVEANARLAYNALNSQGFSPEEIYITGLPEFSSPSRTFLGVHLEELAASDFEYLDLVIYFIGEGYPATFVMNNDGNEDSFLTTSEFADLLDIIQGQEQKSCRVTLIYDANYAGSFIGPLSSVERERTIITSTGRDATAYFNQEGNTCFSLFFWEQVATGASAYTAFAYAKKAITYCIQQKDISFSCYMPQSPLLEANGNGVTNEMSDYRVAGGFAIGKGMKFAADPPQIASATVEKPNDNSLTIIVDVTSTSPIDKVWAVIQSIGYCPGSSEGESRQPTEVELGYVGEGEETGEETGEERYADTIPWPGACRVTVYAMSGDEEEPDVSLPVETKVYQEEGGDIYEDPDGNGISDDVPSEANVIVVNPPIAQPHTFHHSSDVDWVKFYGLSGQVYTIEAEGNPDSYPVIELYDDDHTTLIDWTREPPADDGKMWLDFNCTKNSTYYVKLLCEGCNGEEDVEIPYDLKVYDDNLGLTAIVRGKVRDRVTGEGIDGVVIRSSGVGVTISTHGEYILSEIPGNWILRARKRDYTTAVTGIRINSADQQIREDIRMTPQSKLCAEDADCDDGVYCNGSEICVEGTCELGTDPCSSQFVCFEETDECGDCSDDADCYDEVFCDGQEVCINGLCQEGTYPCAEPTPICDEEQDICTERPSIQLFPNPQLHLRWMPLLMFLRIVGTNTHFDGSTEVIFDPPGTVMALPPILGGAEHLFMLGLIMPSWLSPVESVDVTVSTPARGEIVSGILNLEFLPFMFKEEGTSIIEERGKTNE